MWSVFLGVSTSKWNLEKPDTIVRLLCKRVYTKPNLCLSATKLLKLMYTPLNVSFLKPFTSNNYTVKDSFDFAKDITQQSSKLFMASLDVDSLFTNVSLDETIETCANKLFESSQTVSGLNK